MNVTHVASQRAPRVMILTVLVVFFIQFPLVGATTHASATDSTPGQCVYPQVNEGGPGTSVWNCGAELSGPSSLQLGPCPSTLPADYVGGNITTKVLKMYRCTPSFTLSLSYSAAVYPNNPTQPHGIPRLANYAKGATNELETPGWCPDQTTCDDFTSVPQTIMVLKGTKPMSMLFYVQGPGNCGLANFTCDYQSSITVQVGGTTTTSHPSSRKGPLKVTVSFKQNGQPLVVRVNGQSQKDTLRLADDDKGEVAQDLTTEVTVKNTSKKVQTHVLVNGPPAFSYANASNAQQSLPVGITAGPTPSDHIGTLAPGAKATIDYTAHVTNNGVFDCTAQVLSANQGSTHNLVSQGKGTLTALPTALLWLTLTRPAGTALVTAGTQVEISGTVTNRSLTQTIDVDPLEPADVGNAGGGALVDDTTTPLTDGVILPFAGTIDPGQTINVSGYVQTAQVPSTRATITYDPTGSLVNTDGTETDLTPTQIGLSKGSSEFDIGINTTDPPPPATTPDTVVDNFTDAVVKGTSIWALNQLQAGLEILKHPVSTAGAVGSGVAQFAVGSAQAVQEAASLVSSIYLLGLAAADMTTADRAAWADQITADFKQSHIYLAAGKAQQVYAAVNTAAGNYMNAFADAYTTGNYNQVVSLLGSATATGLTSVEEAMLSDIAFQKFAIGMKYAGTAASSAVKSAAQIATEQGGLANLVSLDAAIRDAKATAVLGKSIDGIEAGTNLLADGAALLQSAFGLTARQIAELQRYCERSNIIVAVRARSSKAAKLIEEGLAVGKNEAIKIKNVNSVDAQFLGYSRHDVNTVVWAQPLTQAEVESSAAWAAADTDTREIVLARLKIRTKEWKDASIKSVINTSESTGEISWGFNGTDNGVAAANRTEYRSFGLKNQPNPVKAGGPARTYQQVLVGNKPGGRGIGRLVPVTQDVDLMAVLSANGEILSAADRLNAYVHLSDIIGIEHPETPTYIKGGEFIFESKVKYLADVTPGGEPLAIFSPRGAVTAGYFDPALTIFDTATHEGRIYFQGGYNDPYSTLKTTIALAVQSVAK
jgi:hypothetical protein